MYLDFLLHKTNFIEIFMFSPKIIFSHNEIFNICKRFKTSKLDLININKDLIRASSWVQVFTTLIGSTSNFTSYN